MIKRKCDKHTLFCIIFIFIIYFSLKMVYFYFVINEQFIKNICPNLNYDSCLYIILEHFAIVFKKV